MVDTVAAASCSAAIAVSPDNSRVYVTSGFTYTFCLAGVDDVVSVIDTASNALVDTVAVEDFPVGLVVTPDGSRVYVANWGNDSVSVIDTSSDTVLTTIGVDVGPFGVDVVPLGTSVYVANASGTVSVIDTLTNAVVDTVPLTGSAAAIGRFIVVPLVPVIPGDGGSRNAFETVDLERRNPEPRLPQLRTEQARARWVRAYYRKLVSKHAAELSRLLLLAPELRRQERDLLKRLRPQIRGLLDGEEVSVSRADLAAVDVWLGSVASDATPGLRVTLEALRKMLRSPAVLERRGVRIQ